jgi:peptidyl-prolyl cis-trans isomerase D
MVAARVLDYRPAKQKDIAEVSGSIREKLLSEQAAKQSEKIGQAMIVQLRQGIEPAGSSSWSAFQMVSRQQPGALDPKALQSVMRLDSSKLPAYSGAALPDGGYRIIRVTRVMSDVEPNPSLRSAVEGGIRQAYARADVAAYIELAKASQKVEIKASALEKK